MRLFANVFPDGSVDAFIAVPDGEAMAMVRPPAGVQTCEITEHDFQGEKLDLEHLAQLRDEYTVDLISARGKLVRRPPEEAR
jgi:hypothetical protein